MLRDPLAKSPLGLGELFASQILPDYLFVALRSLISLVSRETEPHIGEDQVRRDAVTMGVHESKVGLGKSIPLVSRPALPAYGLGIVLEDAFTPAIHHSKVELGYSIPLLGR